MSDMHRIEALEARVAYLEREVEGEKRVTRHILEQTRQNSDDLATLLGRIDRLERKFDTFVDAFPKLVGEAVRSALSQRQG